MTAFAYFGELAMGVPNVMTGPSAATEALENTAHEHKVLRGKPILQDGGEDLDKRSFSFFFDESFCDPQDAYETLKSVVRERKAAALVFGTSGYDGKKYWPKSVSVTLQKTTASGRIVRLEATLDLIEVADGAMSLGSGAGAGGISDIGLLGAGAASLARAILNPLTKRP